MKLSLFISPLLATTLALGFDWMTPRSSAAAVGDEHQVVALSGDLDPLGTAYSTNLYPLGLSNAGLATSYVQKFFGGTNYLYRINPGVSALAIARGSAAPGGSTFNEFSDVDMNVAGNFAATGSTNGGPQAQVFSYLGSTFKSLAATNGAAAGDGTFSEYGLGDVGISDAGAVAFTAKTSGSGYGVFLALPSSALQRIAKVGDSATDGGNFTAFEDRPAVTAPVSGLPQVAFFGKTSGTVGHGLFAGTTAGVRVVAPELYPSDGFGMNNAGQIVWENAGIYINTAAAGTSQLVAANATVPGPRGGQLSNPEAPVINSAGDVVFRTSMTRGSSYLQAIILRTAAGELKPVAVKDEAIEGGVFDALGVPQINDAGMVMFTGTILKGSNRVYGIFLADGSMVTKLIATGDVLGGSVVAVAGGFSASGPDPASRGAMPGHASFNDAGQVAYRALLANGKYGVFLSTPSIPWIATGDAAWDDAVNWGFGHVPGAGSNVLFDSSGYTGSSVPAPGITLRKLTLGHDLPVGAPSYSPQVLDVPAGRTLATARGLDVRYTGVLHGAGNISGGLTMAGYHRRYVGAGQTISGAVAYTGGTLRCIISGNNEVSAPAITGALSIAPGAQFQVALNEAGSSTDFSDPFWLDVHSWRLFSSSSVTGTFQWSGYADIRADSQGVALTDAIGVFSLRYTSKAIELVWTPHQVQPTITAPSDQLVALGAAVGLSTDATGNALAYGWKKNGKPVTVATSRTLTLASAALTHAGSYTVSATNAVGSATSAPPTKLAVLDRRLPSQQIAEASTLSLKVSASGPTGTALSYTWRNGSTIIANGPSAAGGLISGADSAGLKITKASFADAGSYTCTIGMGALSLATEAATIDVVSKPIVDAVAVPVAAVGQAFTWQLTATQLPQSFSITGLPKGLSTDARTGLVHGVPTQSGSFTIKAAAKNAASTSAVRSFALSVDALPTGTAGSFSALISRETTVNGSLGGLLTLTVQPSGAFTGSLRNASSTTAIKGQVLVPASALPHASLAVTPAHRSSLQLELDFDGSNDAISGTLTDGLALATISGRRHTFVGTSASAFAALYNSAIELPNGTVDDGTQPQGSGWQQFTVKSAGTASGTGCTPDGISYTFSGSLWPEGSLPQLVLLYSGKGSLVGLPQITLGMAALDNANNRVGGWVEHYKSGPASAVDRTYKLGIPLLRRDVDGSPWLKPTTVSPIVLGIQDVALGAKNARITFNNGGLSTQQETSLAQDFRFLKNNTTLFDTVAMGNANSVKLTVTPSTGLFTSGFTLLDGITKHVVTPKTHCTGILLSHKAKGVGYFLLSGLAADSDILSGRVVVE